MILLCLSSLAVNSWGKVYFETNILQKLRTCCVFILKGMRKDVFIGIMPWRYSPQNSEETGVTHTE